LGYRRKDAEILTKELGRVFWGTPGRYLPKIMLRAFVDELGPECEALLEGAMEDEADADIAGADNGNSDVLLAVTSDQIKASVVESEDEDEEDEGIPE